MIQNKKSYLFIKEINKIVQLLKFINIFKK